MLLWEVGLAFAAVYYADLNSYHMIVAYDACTLFSIYTKRLFNRNIPYYRQWKKNSKWPDLKAELLNPHSKRSFGMPQFN